jgi:hypothetical protein
MSCREILREGGRLRQNFLLAILFLIVAWNLFRVFFTLDDHWEIVNYMASGLIHSTTIIVMILSQILTVFGLILINQKRMENELTTAKIELKTLSGIIPICSYCKDIRDDAGEWNLLVKYIETHSEAQFSHGICEKSMKEHFPDYVAK